MFKFQNSFLYLSILLQVRMNKFLFILTFAILSLNVSAKISTISGRAPSYSGSKLELKSYVDQISNVERVMASAEVDSLGNFSFVVDLSSTMQLFIPEELFRGFLFVEPGKNYEIRLKNVKLMHNTMIDMNNENAYMAWIWEMPDCPMEEDFEYFAEDEEHRYSSG